MILIVDTNFMITVVKHKIADQIKGLGGQICMPETVEKELSKPSLAPDAKRNAAAALILLEKWGVKVIASKIKNVDNSIVGVAVDFKDRGEEVYVATLDEELKGKIASYGIKTVGIKRQKIVEID
jgi:rRNA-processing protein FCF1